jgi:hypothetical protein
MSTAHERAACLSFSIIQSDSKIGRYVRLPELSSSPYSPLVKATVQVLWIIMWKHLAGAGLLIR